MGRMGEERGTKEGREGRRTDEEGGNRKKRRKGSERGKKSG